MLVTAAPMPAAACAMPAMAGATVLSCLDATDDPSTVHSAVLANSLDGEASYLESGRTS